MVIVFDDGLKIKLFGRPVHILRSDIICGMRITGEFTTVYIKGKGILFFCEYTKCYLLRLVEENNLFDLS